MNYAFKMMAVVLALGVLVLQGCLNSVDENAFQIAKEQRKLEKNIKNMSALSDYDLCFLALDTDSLNIEDMRTSYV